MSTIVLTVNYTGTPDAVDVLAAKFQVRRRNREIVRENEARAAQVPPLPPIPLFPSSTNAELKSSYLAILTEIVINAHLSYITQAQQAKDRITPADEAEIIAAVNTRLDAGESLAAIKADVLSP